MEALLEVTGGENSSSELLVRLREKFKGKILAEQVTCDHIPTVWVARENVVSLLRSLRDEATPCFEMLFDLTAIDERMRANRSGQPDSEFSVVYHLMSFSGNCDFRVKVPLFDADLNIPSVIGLWPAANWYEREAWDMFGINFEGHPNLSRIVLPPTWEGHALRKEHPARATEMEPFSLGDDKAEEEQQALLFKPEDWGMKRKSKDSEFMFLNLGPNHPSVHGAFRIAVQLDGEILVDAVPD
ncbi:MAG: NADH-quinone oxidoreductase subunit C, partial [Gammaproteobacteria bacterium]|nr:NADH-quinone oxidoreductase subunit C [Gammaproteobacteria bacterium]